MGVPEWSQKWLGTEEQISFPAPHSPKKIMAVVTFQACYWWCLYSQKERLKASNFVCRFNLNSSEDAWLGSVHQTCVCSRVNYIQLCVTSCILGKLGYRQQLLMFCSVTVQKSYSCVVLFPSSFHAFTSLF